MTEIPFSPPTPCFLLHCKNNASLEGEDGGGRRREDMEGEDEGGGRIWREKMEVEGEDGGRGRREDMEEEGGKRDLRGERKGGAESLLS